MNASLADWLQGWGTVAGSVFSAIAAITALTLYWREVSNRKNDVEDSASRQARNVLVTIHTPRRPTHLENIEVVAHNFTDEVILELYVSVYRRDSEMEIMWLANDVFEPGEKVVREVNLDPVMRCARPENPSSLFEFNCWFTDSRGYNWYRMDRQSPRFAENSPYSEWQSFRDARASSKSSGDSKKKSS